jgi:Ca2+-binding EF-hand superfamily protein
MIDLSVNGRSFMRVPRGLAAAGAILMVALLARAQNFPGGGMPGGGRGGFGKMGGDPMMFFNMLSKGSDTIVRDQLDDRGKMMFDGMARRMNITGGQITRQQYEQSVKDRAQGGGFGSGAPPAPGGAQTDTGRGGMPNTEAMADEWFDRHDRDRDGLLSNEEMSESLLAEKEKWDTNHDGFIDRTEFRAYFAARIQAMQQERAALGPTSTSEEQDQGRAPAVAYRAGKLPKDIPPWFAQLDTDGDGQIGVYEWRKSGRPLSEFKKYDRNGDNFITVEEVMLVVNLEKLNNGGTAVASNSDRGGMPGFGAGQGGSGTGFGPPGGGMSFRVPGGGSDPTGAMPRGPRLDSSMMPGPRPGGRGGNRDRTSDDGSQVPRGGRGKNKGG